MAPVALLILSLAWSPPYLHSPSAWWVWPGMGYRQLPEQVDLYVLQGRFELGSEGSSRFVPMGLSPHPMSRSGDLYLVYRFDHLASEHQLAGIFEQQRRSWARHGIEVGGIQLDFDSPTRALPEYAVYVARLRGLLGRETQISMTGLGDWLRDDRGTLHAISESVDFVAFQLYVGRQPLENLPVHYDRLAKLNIPFKVGLLYKMSQQSLPAALLENPNFTGRMIFRTR